MSFIFLCLDWFLSCLHVFLWKCLFVYSDGMTSGSGSGRISGFFTYGFFTYGSGPELEAHPAIWPDMVIRLKGGNFWLNLLFYTFIHQMEQQIYSIRVCEHNFDSDFLSWNCLLLLGSFGTYSMLYVLIKFVWVFVYQYHKAINIKK